MVILTTSNGEDFHLRYSDMCGPHFSQLVQIKIVCLENENLLGDSRNRPPSLPKSGGRCLVGWYPWEEIVTISHHTSHSSCFLAFPLIKSKLLSWTLQLAPWWHIKSFMNTTGARASFWPKYDNYDVRPVPCSSPRSRKESDFNADMRVHEEFHNQMSHIQCKFHLAVNMNEWLHHQILSLSDHYITYWQGQSDILDSLRSFLKK